MKRKVAEQGGPKVLVDFEFARPIPPQPYLCQFVHQWLDFRLPELVAACEATATTLTVDAADAAALPSSTCCRVTLNDDASARRVAARSVLVKRFIEVWASGDSWDEMVRALAASPSQPGWAERAACIAEGTTFCVRVEAFGRHFSEAEALEHIQKLEGVLPWRGRVRLKGPQHAFLILFELDDAADGAAAAPAAVRRVHFGRVVAAGAHKHFATHYSLKSRNYIGTTSLDAELGFLMANLGRVRRGHLVLDPFCGTAGCLVPAGHFGARVVGSDLFLPVLRGKVRSRSGPGAKEKNAAAQGIGHTFAQYDLAPPVGLVHADAHGGGGGGYLRRAPLFDAILSDPPYGIREKSAALDDAPLTDRTLGESQVADHIPRRAQASLDLVLVDLFALAARTLVVGGRLVFLLPCSLPIAESLALMPPHPGLVLEETCEQKMAARWSRWCVVMRRVDDGGDGGGGAAGGGGGAAARRAAAARRRPSSSGEASCSRGTRARPPCSTRSSSASRRAHAGASRRGSARRSPAVAAVRRRRRARRGQKTGGGGRRRRRRRGSPLWRSRWRGAAN